MESDTIIRKLVIHAGFAAMAHGLRKEMLDILRVLPDWLDTPEQLAGCAAIGLHRPGSTPYPKTTAQLCAPY